MKLYESQTVADAGARAVTQGSNIAFAPGKLDFVSTSGQALLGHELSHVVSQARGESAGQGFLKDASLEAQADRQGMMAARGESVYSGPVTPVSVSSASAASGPMQASKAEDNALAQREAQIQGSSDTLPTGMLAQGRFRNTWLNARTQRQNSPFYQLYNQQVGNAPDNNRMSFLYDAIHSTINRGNSQTAADINSGARMAMTELAMEIQGSGDSRRTGRLEGYVGDMMVGRGDAAQGLMQSYNNTNSLDERYLEVLAQNDALDAIGAGIGSTELANIAGRRPDLDDSMNQAVSNFNSTFGQTGVPQNFAHEPGHVANNRNWLISNINNINAQAATPANTAASQTAASRADARAARRQARLARQQARRDQLETARANRQVRNGGGRSGIFSRLASSFMRHTHLG